MYDKTYNYHCQGMVTPIGAVSRAVTAVKMQSNSQGTFLGLVKINGQAVFWVLLTAIKRRGQALCMCTWSLINGSRAKIHRGQAVKAIFRQSKILTTVAALDTVPMGVSPPRLSILGAENQGRSGLSNIN